MTENELMLTHVRRCRRVDLYADQRPLTAPEETELARLREHRGRGEPLQYVLGECEFCGLTFSVDPRVLIPRPETEILVEKVLSFAVGSNAGLRFLDVGTGSGNIAVTLAKTLVTARLTALDISVDALAVARENAKQHGVSQRIEFVAGEMEEFFAKGEGRGGKFDVIVSNPPYIPSAQIESLSFEVRQEPRLALDGGADGLDFYRQIIARAPSALVPGGMLFLEIGDGERFEIEKIFAGQPQYQEVDFVKDHAGTDRVLCARLAG